MGRNVVRMIDGGVEIFSCSFLSLQDAGLNLLMNNDSPTRPLYMDITDSLVYEQGKLITFLLVINNEPRKVRFIGRHMPKEYYCSSRLVWVAIPGKDGIDNRTFQTRFATYSNKVRKALLEVRKIDSRYILLDRYEVLKQDGEIVSWVNSKKGKRYSDQEAQGYARPCGTYRPYRMINW